MMEGLPFTVRGRDTDKVPPEVQKYQDSAIELGYAELMQVSSGQSLPNEAELLAITFPPRPTTREPTANRDSNYGEPTHVSTREKAGNAGELLTPTFPPCPTTAEQTETQKTLATATSAPLPQTPPAETHHPVNPTATTRRGSRRALKHRHRTA